MPYAHRHRTVATDSPYYEELDGLLPGEYVQTRERTRQRGIKTSW